MTHVRRNSTTGKDEFSFGEFKLTPTGRIAVPAYYRKPSTMNDADWAKVRWGFEKGRYEGFSGQDVEAVFESTTLTPTGVFRRTSEALSFGLNVRGFLVNFIKGDLTFTNSHVVEFKLRVNARPSSGVWALFSAATLGSASDFGITVGGQNYNDEGNLLRFWNSHSIGGLWNTLTSIAQFESILQDGNLHDVAIQFDFANRSVNTWIDGIWRFTDSLQAGFVSAGMKYANPNMLIGQSPNTTSFGNRGIVGNMAPRGLGFELERLMFTDGLKYTNGVAYTVQPKWYPFDISRFDPHFDSCVFYLDGLVTPNEIRDLTGRHSIDVVGSLAMVNGKVANVGGVNRLACKGNLADFTYATGEDFRIDFAFDVYNNPLAATGVSASGPYIGGAGNTGHYVRFMDFKNSTLTRYAQCNAPGATISQALADEVGDFSDQYPLMTERHPNYCTYMRKDGYLYFYINGRNAYVSSAVNTTQFNFFDTASNAMNIGYDSRVAQGNYAIADIYAVRFYKGSTGGLTGQEGFAPLEFGLMRNV